MCAIASGLSNDARGAVESAIESIPKENDVVAIGIDAPLYWPISGSRAADVSVRAAIKAVGAPHAAGTVQDVNSLRGACLVQGMLAALALRAKFPEVPITEAHPKALRWLLPDVAAITAFSEHEHDALLAAIGAWGATHSQGGWRDLKQDESQTYIQ